MIDFENNGVFKLSPVEPESQMNRVAPLLIEGEYIVAAFKAIRDSVVFTNKRVIAMNVQGITGKKVDYTSLPYSKVQAYSVETAGTFAECAAVSAAGEFKTEFLCPFFQ